MASGAVGMRGVRGVGQGMRLYFLFLHFNSAPAHRPLLDSGPVRPFSHARLEAVIIRGNHHFHLHGKKGERPQPTEACPSSQEILPHCPRLARGAGS